MTAHVLWTEHERSDAIGVLRSASLPCTFRLERGADRSIDQNALMWLWYREICDQLNEQSPPELHTECKLTLGVPIILADPRKDQETFRESWNLHLAHQPYEIQRDLIEHMPVTSMMTTHQMTEYLNAIHKRFTIENGVKLTEPK